MKRVILVDTGPLVAYVSQRDSHHDWATEWSAKLDPPFLTCEAVIAEASHLLRRTREGSVRVLDMIRDGLMRVAFQLESEITRVAELMQRYSNVPMSLADACLVRMSELHADSLVFTLDGDFRIYRRSGRQVIPTILPDDR